jgi:hypothetical protein
MAQSGGFVDVQNSGAVDVNPPVLVSVTGLPAAADVSSPVPVTLTITATDDASGMQSGSIYLTTNSQSSSTSYGIATFTSANLVSGSTTVYEVQFDLTDFILPGHYELEMTLTDFTGKVRYYDTLHEDLPAGSTGTVTINLGGGGYAAWAATQDFGPGGLDGELDDPNNDGVNNLLCYAFNLTPLAQATRMTPDAGDTAGLPAISVIGDGPSRRLRIEYLHRIGASSGLTYRPQFGTSLSPTGPGAWQDAAATPPIAIDTDWERIVIEDPVQGAPSRFGRVLIEHAAP